MEPFKYTIGVDYGTDSVRTVFVDTADGREVASSVFVYPRWKQGLYCDASQNRFRQHPLDYIEGLEATIKDCVSKCSTEVINNIVAISIDTTGSTPVAVNRVGVPLSLLPGFNQNPDAMFILWKDHTAIDEAEAINKAAANSDLNYVKYCGGIYSSEWFWAKMLHILRRDESIRQACFTWVEHSDWMPFMLTGGNDARQIKRNVCAAGHKALWAAEHGGFPPNAFFASVDPLLKDCVQKINPQVHTADKAAGLLSPEWAEKLGLPSGVLVGVGAIDAHVGAVGGQIEPYFLSKVMGTSTCDMLVVPHTECKDKFIKGISGQVDGSIVPGMIGLEAGQAAFGDVYAWFKNMLLWPVSYSGLEEDVKATLSQRLLQQLDDAAAIIEFDAGSEIAVDWLNGRRTPDADPALKGALGNLTLATDAPRVYRALVEATCFGSRRIIERIRSEGVNIEGVIALGGIARRSPYVMQVMADVLGMSIKVHASEQACAAGAAMLAATVAGIYPSVTDAMAAMGKGFDIVYTPDAAKINLYAKRYKKYNKLCAAVGALGNVDNDWAITE